ncbi:Vitamin B12 import system permease protein BtuC [Streptomyces chrestomyceticus JCM 4735]|uniref:Vitamin B12 import system permease protein BtuC n=1 Tax=Streptomyces chrestomyceticus JCM 4735 TaxID=1306181 RepID=A0A7U9KVX3_9ACTN|nr:Vitamin B12 import system permease protein BtuC [Streptomyces chrestomyceticus JCM 4735]
MTAPATGPGAAVRHGRARPAGYGLVRAGRGSFLVHRRAAAVAGVLAVLLAAVCLAYLCVGESFVAPGEALKAAFGQPSSAGLVVGTLRLPRMVVGLLTGAAFGWRAR